MACARGSIPRWWFAGLNIPSLVASYTENCGRSREGRGKERERENRMKKLETRICMRIRTYVRSSKRERRERKIELAKKRGKKSSSAITEHLRSRDSQPNMEQSQISIRPNREYTRPRLRLLLLEDWSLSSSSSSLSSTFPPVPSTEV